MTNTLIAAVVVSAALSVGRSEARSATAATVACRAQDTLAVMFRNYVVQVATGTDSTSISLRTSWNIPEVADTSVVFVTDSVLCSSAAIAQASVEGDDVNNPPPVHLLRVGTTRYVAWNYSRRSEYYEYLVFDTEFQLLSTIGT